MALRCLVVLQLLAVFVLTGPAPHAAGEDRPPRVPAIMFFGDSLVDAGNNDYVNTIVKANLSPYGRDFQEDHVATGRFCNGKLISDIIGEKLGFSVSPPAYLSPEASGKKLLLGANFAYAGSGYYDPTSLMYKVIPLSQQLEYFNEYRSKLTAVAGSSQQQAQSIVSNSLYIISAGSNDFGFNYYINPLLLLTQTADQFSDRLIGIFNNTVTQLYGMGARRVGVLSLAPLGCAPLAITVFGLGSNSCVQKLNNDALRYIHKLNTAVDSLSERHHDLKIAVLDIYTPWYSCLATSPESQGFTEARLGCCATGKVELTVLLCNPFSVGTCRDAATYVHWDSVHPSEATNRVIVDSLVENINMLVT